MLRPLREMFVAAVVLIGCGDPAGPAAGPTAPPPVPVAVSVLAPQTFEVEERAVGVVVAPDSVELRPETSGLVRQVLFTDGQSVAKGAPLVRLVDGEAQAALLDAQSRATLARLNLDRTRALLERQDVSQAELDRAAAEDGLARAAVMKATEGLRKTQIVAPFAGMMGRRDVAPGALVDPAKVVGRIEDLSALGIDLTLPESALGRLQVGQAARLTVDAVPGLEASATVAYVSPRVREDSRTVDLRLRIEAPDPRLRPGMSVDVRILVEKREGALLVPTEAVVLSGDRVTVWVLGPDGVVASRAIRPGERSTAFVEVREGLTAGEQVIVQGLARLKPGAKAAVPAPAAP